MKQHFVVLMEMLDNNKNNCAIEYLGGLIEANPLKRLGVSRTDNVVVDALINAKYSLAQKLGIKIELDIHIPMHLPFEGADIGILLGNILDNAIEASLQIQEEKRQIRLYMKYENNMLIITSINSFSGELIRNQKGKIISKKDNPDCHGIGLESVRKVAEKYYGSVVIEDKMNQFVKIILCDLPQKLQATS